VGGIILLADPKDLSVLQSYVIKGFSIRNSGSMEDKGS